MSAAPQSDMQTDVAAWLDRASHTAKDPSGIRHPTGTAPWSASFFGCFCPLDTCAITCCCPCVTFGKTHHRLHKDGGLAGYSAVNASCLGWLALACVGVHCVPSLLQRHDVRTRAQPELSGNSVSNFFKTWCCSYCDLIQQDKEAERLLALEPTQVYLQPGKVEAMSYGPQ